MKITNLKGLEDRRIVEVEDRVYFTVGEEHVEYKVDKWYLDCYSISNNFNYKIFNLLKIDKLKLASEVYGYEASFGDWPSCKSDDYPALTRLVKELYKIIEEKYPTEVYIPINSRFDILDL